MFTNDEKSALEFLTLADKVMRRDFETYKIHMENAISDPSEWEHYVGILRKIIVARAAQRHLSQSNDPSLKLTY